MPTADNDDVDITDGSSSTNKNDPISDTSNTDKEDVATTNGKLNSDVENGNVLEVKSLEEKNNIGESESDEGREKTSTNGNCNDNDNDDTTDNVRCETFFVPVQNRGGYQNIFLCAEKQPTTVSMWDNVITKQQQEQERRYKVAEKRKRKEKVKEEKEEKNGTTTTCT